MSAADRGVLHLVDSLGLGGAQMVLKAHFEANASDEELFLVALRSSGTQTTIRHPNVAVYPSSRRFSFAPLVYLRRFIKDHSIGLLHCHLFRAQVFGFLLKSLFFPRMALVFHEHGRVMGREDESALEAYAFRAFLRRARGRVDKFVCVSAMARERLLELIPDCAGTAVVIANPVPVRPAGPGSIDRSAARRARRIPEGAFVVGFASRLVEMKGWADFLEAIARLRDELPVHFLLAGDGQDRASVEARIGALGLDGRGDVLGHIEWMADFYRCLDCFVMPSHWEAHGLGHLEAQGFGVPVIVSDVPGLASTVHPGVDALLCKPHDPDCLAREIRRLAHDDALRARLASAGLANAARYSLESFAAKMREAHGDARRRAAAGSIGREVA